MMLIRTLISTPANEKLILAVSLVTVVAIRLCLTLVPFRLLRRGLFPLFSAVDVTTDVDWGRIYSIARSVRAASRVVPAASCLTQAVSGAILMRLSGQAVDIKIGVGRDESQKLIAHAWLEKNGKVILGRSSEKRFVVLRSGAGNAYERNSGSL